MTKLLRRLLPTLVALLAMSQSTHAIGWPYDFEGVMLQGFYWDSYQTETTWTKLEARSDELAPYFRLIWVPNAGRSTGGLGYIPIYWFNDYNSSMGNEQQLRSTIKTYNSKGTDLLMDLVINHRGGVSSWTDFPTETWNGRTWHIGLDGICCTDEVAYAEGQPKPTGAADEGQDFDGARDLDHTNANVQENCKAYCKFLLDDMGFAGFRLDMVKGYAGYYTKMYNQYAKPTYSVGEYWDGYDNITGWIEATGGESAAFDFPFKYACNEAFSTGDMTKLVWLENGETPKPAGLIHHWYQQLAVTFLDNHDTYRDDWNKFQGNWAAANAFMICSPGTPCVFLPHWNACGDQIARMIEARNLAGVTNTSEVRVLRSTQDCYMAELDGKYGKLAVKIGPAMVSPEGYTNDMIYTTGEDYCIWTTVKKPEPVTYPSELYLMGHVESCNWNPSKGVAADGTNGHYTWSAITVDDSGDGCGYIAFAEKLGSSASDWNGVNSGNRYGAASKDLPLAAGTPDSNVTTYGSGTASSCKSWKVEAGLYNITLDLPSKTLSISEATFTDIDIEDADTAAPVYFNLQGLRVDNPGKGLYIKVEKGHTTKVRL